MPMLLLYFMGPDLQQCVREDSKAYIPMNIGR